jgi:glycosyltransferase involved in cell wall biosynthesis
MEAMAMELPVVTTAISGIPELVENEYNGLIAETDDAVDLANRIRQIIDDPSFSKRLGHNARKKIEAEFNQVTIGAVLADRICLPAQSER